MFDPNLDFQAYLKHKSYTPSAYGLHTRASEAAQCARKIYYRLQEGDSNLHAPTNSIIEAVGKFLHDQYINMLKLHFPFTTGEVKWTHPNDVSPTMTGRADGIYIDTEGKKVALEIKTKSKFQYASILKVGALPVEMSLQAAISGYILETDMVEVVVICREWIPDADPVTHFKYQLPKTLAINEINRLAVILETSKRKEIPNREIGGELIKNPDKDKRCSFCDFRDMCVLQGQ